MKRVRKILTFSYLIALLALWQSCIDSLAPESPSKESQSDELEVDFNLYWPEAETRAIIDSNGTERFLNADVIHIVGTFNTRELQENGEYKTDTISRYGALRYNGTNWIAVEGSNLTWPTTATDGQFQAYYLSESNGVLTIGATDTYPLSNLSSTTDPLIANSAPGIKYGNAVKLEFTHLCAHLTLTNLEPQVADAYWMIRPEKIFEQNGTTPATFNNAFKIELGQGDYGPELIFSFTQLPSPEYKGLVYVSGNPYVVEPSQENPFQSVNVEYYLEPGYYNSFQLVYPVTSDSTYPYLEYNYSPDQNPGAESSIAPQLNANVAYTLNITKNSGTTIVTPPTEGGWDENTQAVIIVDVEAFLKAAQNGEAYSEKSKDTQQEVPILEKTANGSKLLRNVDFDYFEYSKFKDSGFQPNLPENITFDGDLHYIQNLNDPLFRDNNGKILNLGIRNVKANNIISEENENASLDNSRNGALCHFNIGTINNIRARDITLNVKVRSYIQTDEDGSETHNIGGLVGSNKGNINEVNFAGNVNITVANYVADGNEVNASVLIGGIAGQNAAEGTISEVSTIENENLSITITNNCIGSLGDYSVGGFVGQSNGFLYNINLSGITIDGTKSEGVTSFMGGMVGQLTVEEDSSAEISGCSVSGSARAGKTLPYNNISSVSYTGGISGAVFNTSVTDCGSLMSVAGASASTLYATGGAFGRIRNSTFYNFSDLIIWGNSLTGPANYIGTFSGIAPKTDEWEAWYKDFDNYNIRVKPFDGIKSVGYLNPQN